MTRIITLIALAASLSGCTTLWSYRPALSQQPRSEAKYEADLTACRDYVWDTKAEPTAGQIVSGGFGALGAGIYYAASGEKHPKESFDRVDDCMADKGYAVEKRS